MGAGVPPDKYTIVQAVKLCEDLSTPAAPLGLCNSACAGLGCQYNQYPVYTQKPCTLPELASPPPPPPTSSNIGAAVLHGTSGKELACLSLDDDQTLKAPYAGADKKIAVQCCRTDLQAAGASEAEYCRRYIGSTSNCIAGVPPAKYTIVQAIKLCEDLSTPAAPLGLCNSACVGLGCQYN